MKILIAGCNGMLGRDLMKAFGGANEISGCDIDRVDIVDEMAIAKLVERERPEIVINAAAYTNVDMAESDPDKAFAVNTAGAGNVAKAARRIGAQSVYYSTDYVFGGGKSVPYVEDDEKNPQGVYAKSKAAGEKAAIEGDPDVLIIRTAWLYGANGKNFVDTMLTLSEQKDELRVVDDQKGSPTWTVHLAEATVNLTAARAKGVVHATNSGEVTWFGFAKKIFELARRNTKVAPITTAELARPAMRPAYSVLDTSKYTRLTGKVMPHWEAGLNGYLKSKGVI